MLALYRSGRQAEALARYREGRRAAGRASSGSSRARRCRSSSARSSARTPRSGRGPRPSARGRVVCCGCRVRSSCSRRSARGRELLLVELVADAAELPRGAQLDGLDARPRRAACASAPRASPRADPRRGPGAARRRAGGRAARRRRRSAGLARGAPCDVARRPARRRVRAGAAPGARSVRRRPRGVGRARARRLARARARRCRCGCSAARPRPGDRATRAACSRARRSRCSASPDTVAETALVAAGRGRHPRTARLRRSSRRFRPASSTRPGVRLPSGRAVPVLLVHGRASPRRPRARPHADAVQLVARGRVTSTLRA